MKPWTRIETYALLAVNLAAWTVVISAARDMIEASGLVAVLVG